jgi:predicted nucleic acid-binding protein
VTTGRGPLVVDASVSLAWLFEDEASRFTESLLDRIVDSAGWVPVLWGMECINVLLSAQRRGRIDASQRLLLVERVSALPLRVDREPVDLRALDDLASRHGLSAYDAAYLELAARRALPLATLDKGLARAARAAGVAVEAPSRS